MFEKVKQFVVDHKFDVIEKGSMVVGAILGLVAVALTMSTQEQPEPYDVTFNDELPY